MNGNQDEFTEAELGRAAWEAFEASLKKIRNEPTLVIELGESESSDSEETIADIRAWLFKRR